MSTLWLDSETFCETPINHGVHRYAEDVEVMVTSWAWDDAPVTVWDHTAGDATMADVQALVDAADEIVIHNSGFDRTVYRPNGVTIPVEKIVDTMVQALSHSLPGSLDTLCEVLGVPQDKAKLKTGRRWIQLFCKPLPKNQKLRRATRETHPKEWAEFLVYAGMDITSMREIRKRMPAWNYPREPERSLWVLDQRINDRGVAVDVDLARCALRATERAQKKLSAAATDLSDGVVTSATQRARVIAYLHEAHGFAMADLKGSTVDKVLESAPDLHPEVREMLLIRQQAAATTPAKYGALLKGVSTRDDRLRGTLQFCGASRTGRDAGRLFQPQNLARPDMPNEAIESGIAAIKQDCEDLLYPNVTQLVTNAARGALVAPKGKKLLVADLSNIEGRMTAWLAGETWKLQAFRDYDAGVGHDLYKVTAGEILGKDPEDITKDERQVYGKVPELACLLEGTLVLTACGEKPIEKVLPGDLVWDGISWVRTDGPIYRGEKHVIEYDGLCATPDHIVWVEGQTDPVELGRAAADGLRLFRTRAPYETAVPARGKTTDSRSTAMHESQRPGLQKLRGSRCGISFRNSSPGVRVGTGELGIAPRTSRTGPDRQQWPLRTGKLALVDQSGELFTHPAQQTHDSTASFSRAVPTRSLRGLHVEKFAISRSVIRGDRGPLVHAELQTKRAVWDLLNCGPLHRFTAQGRLVHNCGFGGSVGAFASMGAVYGVELPESQAREIVYAWRAKHPAIVAFWYDMERAARRAIGHEGGVHRAGRIAFQRTGAWMRMRLPSGRYLCYAAPRIEDESIYYEGVNQYTRRWDKLYTYGGKLVENAVQASARDVFFWWMRRAEEAGYHVVMRVHDELICEVPDTDEWTVEGLIDLLGVGPDYVEGLPLAAAGHEMYRYHKAD